MRLLCTENCELEDWVPELGSFEGQNVLSYAILSHTWGTDEVLFEDVCQRTTPSKEGYSKIKLAACQARNDEFAYIWIDTCCIDKSSSAELSEAINSMYVWYENAGRCYAYLEDVCADVDLSTEGSTFATSRWFTRGWCLQELIAPSELVFYSKDWVLIGDKQSLCKMVSKVTGIDVDVLLKNRGLASISIAERMSWAAQRQTTRVEDIAYCLMGIFSVNMPMLYGEGTKAFHRLQKTIMEQSDDHSIFAWVEPEAPAEQLHGLLADRPSAFGHLQIRCYADWSDRSPFVAGNRGLMIDLHLSERSKGEYAAALNCYAPLSNLDAFIAVHLKKLGGEYKQYARVRCAELCFLSKLGPLETIFVKQDVVLLDTSAVYPEHFLRLCSNQRLGLQGYFILDIMPKGPDRTIASPDSEEDLFDRWIPRALPNIFRITKRANTLAAAILLCRKADLKIFLMLFGSTTAFEIGWSVQEYHQDPLQGAFETSQRRLLPLETLQDRYHPQSSGTSAVVDHQQFRVDIQPHPWRYRSASKIYEVYIQVRSVTEAKGHVGAAGTVSKVTESRLDQDATSDQKFWKKILHRRT